MTFVLGLTGSVGMGKSTTAEMFRAAGIPVHDADAVVHRLYRGAAVPLIEKAFPSAIADGAVDRAALGRIVLNDPAALSALEAIVHPLVRAEEEQFLRGLHADREPLVVLDIPLLLETGSEARCDAVLVVTASPDVQRQRVLARPGMTEEKFAALLAKQMPDGEKRRRAHFRIETDGGLDSARAQVRSILTCLAARPGRVLHRPTS